MANIYDGAFRTILNDCRKLIIPVINEIFGETYTGEEEIRFYPNEHFLDQQDKADRERITDTNFTVLGKIPKKYHVECESSLPDGKIMIRLFEYDAQIALDESDVTEETLTVTFPNTAVLYLRTYKKTPDKMKYVLVTPGGTVQYDVPIMKMQTYSLDEIFEKGLLLLIPFHIFSHESNFPEYNSNEQRLEELKAEYRRILERLDEQEQQGIKQGIEQGIKQGIGQGASAANRETAFRMLNGGRLSVQEIAEYTGLSVAEVESLAQVQTV